VPNPAPVGRRLRCRHKLHDIEHRIREAEVYVASGEFKLKRDFREL
jgi:hypothetical protein